MHYNNVGLLATALLASTATAIPRIPHHVAVAAAGGTSDPSQEGRNVMQRSEEKTASQGNADFLLDTVGGQLGRRSEQKTASKDNADFLFDLGDKTDSEDEGDGQNSRVIHRYHGKRSLEQRSEAGTATLSNEDLMYSATGDEGFPNLRALWRGGKTERSEETASKDNADFWGPGGGYGGYGDSNKGATIR
ncbi:hypothetical protein AKAW_07254 [Aspergillus luchuensis IFO 4308]|nr:hypothetical protein ALUC_81213A [Aspergillus luchuensis]GAA89140.1 hypothetical protein AKAW_07254 [Aspergillus luchuensis IFO 4308]